MQEALGLIPGSGKASGERNGYSLQYCCLENFMDRGTWWATAHEITESDTIEQLTLEIYLTFLEVKWSELAQSCPTLCDPMDCSPPGSSVHGIFRQEYWSGLLFSPPGDFPNPWTEPMSPVPCPLHGRWILHPLSHLLNHIYVYVYSFWRRFFGCKCSWS